MFPALVATYYAMGAHSVKAKSDLNRIKGLTVLRQVSVEKYTLTVPVINTYQRKTYIQINIYISLLIVCLGFSQNDCFKQVDSSLSKNQVLIS